MRGGLGLDGGPGADAIGSVSSTAVRVRLLSGAQEPWASEAVRGRDAIGGVEPWVWAAGQLRTPSERESPMGWTSRASGPR